MKNGKQSSIIVITMMFSFVMCIGRAQSYEVNASQGKTGFQWPEGKKMALTLTFDDARLSAIDKGISLLDKYGVKATFYIYPKNLLQRLNGWKEAVKNGHDIGNHAVFHPCSGNFLWARENALENYTLKTIAEELDSANRFIKEKLGVEPVSFAYPCGQKFVGREVDTKSYVPVVASMFETGRGWIDEAPNDPAYCDMSQLTGMRLDQKSFDEILMLIETTKSEGLWLILAGHEMDEKDDYHTSLLSTIEKICQYAINPENGIWIDNIHNIALYIKEKRRKNPLSVQPASK